MSITHAIIAVLRTSAYEKGKPFDGGVLLLAMAFKSDEELMEIAQLARVL
jgi:hypothetical protein